MERCDEDLSETVSNYLDSRMYTIIHNCAESTIKDKIRWMDFDVNVLVKNKAECKENE